MSTIYTVTHVAKSTAIIVDMVHALDVNTAIDALDTMMRESGLRVSQALTDEATLADEACDRCIASVETEDGRYSIMVMEV